MNKTMIEIDKPLEEISDTLKFVRFVHDVCRFNLSERIPPLQFNICKVTGTACARKQTVRMVTKMSRRH